MATPTASKAKAAAYEAKDAARDRKAGVKEGSPADMKMDAKAMKPMMGGSGGSGKGKPFGGKQAPPFGGGAKKGK